MLDRSSADVRLETQVEPDLPQVLVNPDRILQALLNLASNALKFAPPGSAVQIIAARGGGDGGAMIRFSVVDQGQGIPADKVDWLFKRFQQLDASSTRRVQGTGLGLAITKALVEEHGGEVSVASVEGRGSTFSFTVPIAR